MHKPPGNVCCHFFNFPVRLRRTLRWCGSNCIHSTTASSIEIWPFCVNGSIKCRRACPMDVGSPLPCAQPVAFFLRRRCPKYRDTLLSGLRHFIAWYEMEREAHVHDFFTPQGITTPALTRYRTYLQTVGRQKPASVNRSLISLKRYFGWALQQHIITYDPSTAVKLVGQEESAPRHLDDQEEQALVASVTSAGNLRDRVLIVLLLHTGLRAREICRLRRDQVKLGKRSGLLEIIGKRNKYREVPLNATARKMLEEYLLTLPPNAVFLFPSGKTKSQSALQRTEGPFPNTTFLRHALRSLVVGKL